MPLRGRGWGILLTGRTASTCPRCGYSLIASNDDIQPVAVSHPWHLRDKRMLHEYVRSLSDETHEWLLALYVDNALNLLAVDTIARGSVSEVAVDFPTILCRGHAYKAAWFILVHNHPSGDPSPSQSDIRLTARLRYLSHEFDLPLLDHCIVAGGRIETIGGIR